MVFDEQEPEQDYEKFLDRKKNPGPKNPDFHGEAWGKGKESRRRTAGDSVEVRDIPSCDICKYEHSKDGVPAEVGDCDDTNAAVFPGAKERWFDGVDSDCDGKNNR
jgi:hypothetical protein